MTTKKIAKNEEIDEYSNRELIKDVWQYTRPYKGRFFLGSALRLMGDLANLYPAIALSSIVTFFSVYQTGSSINTFWTLVSLWILAAFVRLIGNYSSKYIIYQIAEKITLDSQLAVIRHLFRLDIAWHERENVGNRLKKVQRGSNGLDRSLRMWVNNYIEIGVNFSGILIILGGSDLRIAALMAFFILTYFLISFFSLYPLVRQMKVINDKEEEISGLIYQALNNIRSVKITNIADKIYGMLQVQSEDIFAWIRRRVFGFQGRGAVLAFWAILFRLIVTIVIALSIAEGQAGVGLLILFNMYFNRIMESVSELSSITQELMHNRLAIGRMQAIFAETEVDNDGAGRKFPVNWQKLTVRDLAFAYGENRVIENISFEIQRGERVGIVGLSGAGKSTLFKLLLKENEKYEGTIAFDGLSLHDIRKGDYYDHVGVVLQDTEVFNFSLQDNITIASKRQPQKAALERALAVANVDDFLPRLSDGLDTIIGEKGVKLSGGEKQRLGIARAVYKQPQILFLDEATSHLDLESEEKIKESLGIFFRQVTAIVIAHRLSTIREMDRIILIEGGRIAEMGSFPELMARGGRFSELWNKQVL